MIKNTVLKITRICCWSHAVDYFWQVMLCLSAGYHHKYISDLWETLLHLKKHQYTLHTITINSSTQQKQFILLLTNCAPCIKTKL